MQDLNGTDIGGIFALLGNSDGIRWTIASGVPANPQGNAQTLTNRNTPSVATTLINPSYTSAATNIAVARTLIHESLHAYLAEWGALHNMPSNTALDALLDGYVRGTTFTPTQEHDLMASIVSQMADALQAYANANGLVLDHTRAENLFWAGLRFTNGYAQLSAARRDEISRQDSAETQNTNVPNPITGGDIIPQGVKACN